MFRICRMRAHPAAIMRQCGMTSPLPLQVVARTFSKSESMTYDQITDKFKTANNLLDIQKISTELYSDHDFLGTWKVDKYEYITYEEFDKACSHFRRVLSDAGVGKDDKVAIISNNRVEWGVGCFAAYGVGAQVVPLYEAQTEKDWRYILGDCSAKVLLVSSEAIYEKTRRYLDSGDFPHMQRIICFDADASKEYSYKALMAASASRPEPAPVALPPSFDDLVAIIYTSGSTGSPKGVELSHRNIMSNLKGIQEVWGPIFAKKGRTKEKSVNYLPWGHIFGFTTNFHASLVTGGSVALTPNREAIISSCELVHPVEMTTVPLVVNKIYHGVFAKVGAGSIRRQKIVAKAFEIARARNTLLEAGLPVPVALAIKFAVVNYVVMSKIRSQILGGQLEILSAGGGKTSLEVLQFFEDVGLPLCEGYGMTEASPIITLSTSPGFQRRRLGSVGQALPGCLIEIRDPVTLEKLPTGTQGEIFAAGDNIAVGYHKQPKATADTFVTDPSTGLRFLRTGDLGYLDKDEFLYISGRIKEQYKLQNGKFVSPSPLEDAYNRSMFVSQTVVCGADREYNVGLIAPDLVELQRWAKENGVPFPSSKADMKSFYSNPAVIALITQELRRFEGEINSYERIRAWTFIEPLSPENDLLTQKMSLKRHNIATVYADTINGLYSGAVGNSMGNNKS